MKQYWGLEQVPADSPWCVLTIGNFDGVHRGHQAILARGIEKAKASGLQAAALIFDPHPTKIVRPGQTPALLTQPAERLRRFKKLGLAVAVVMEFTAEVAAMSPSEFIAEVVVKRLRARAVIVGENFRFGCRQAGDFAALRSLGEQFGFEAEAVAAFEVDREPVSSTRVRSAATAGDMRLARHLLGRPFSLRGRVVAGHGVGARATVPTLNLEPDSEVMPASGVYITMTCDNDTGRSWNSVSNVGYRPTFDGDDLSIETHLLDEFSGEPPAAIRVSFLKRLRGEKRFPSADVLKRQILADIQSAQHYFRRLASLRDAAKNNAGA
ncbi:MAG: bifunctional riboflavin kinase/FAD synthetase [Acidobacteria bacterium]|nr:bifunctional riboflavin kinase/FAD synthetase [Acidobacteriota bacterium]